MSLLQDYFTQGLQPQNIVLNQILATSKWIYPSSKGISIGFSNLVSWNMNSSQTEQVNAHQLHLTLNHHIPRDQHICRHYFYLYERGVHIIFCLDKINHYYLKITMHIHIIYSSKAKSGDILSFGVQFTMKSKVMKGLRQVGLHLSIVFRFIHLEFVHSLVLLAQYKNPIQILSYLLTTLWSTSTIGQNRNIDWVDSQLLDIVVKLKTFDRIYKYMYPLQLSSIFIMHSKISTQALK